MGEPENTNAAIKCEEVGREEEKNSHGRLSNSRVAIACSDAQEEKTWSLGELKLGRTHHCSHTSHPHQGRSDVQNQAQPEGVLPSWGPYSAAGCVPDSAVALSLPNVQTSS